MRGRSHGAACGRERGSSGTIERLGHFSIANGLTALKMATLLRAMFDVGYFPAQDAAGAMKGAADRCQHRQATGPAADGALIEELLA